MRSFEFKRDTLTFANELIWRYHFDPVSGALSISRNDPAPAYSHRCFVLVRSARQFFYHARFDPALPIETETVYRSLIREVVSRNPRRPSAMSDRITIPGFDCLRAFSQAHESALKAECGGPWQSYFLRSHWRMVFPVPAGHQERMAQELQQAVGRGLAPIVHIFRFPRVTINHGILLFAARETQQRIEFQAYDPNLPEQPIQLIYHRDQRTFHFPPTCYWAGGMLKVVHIYCGGLY